MMEQTVASALRATFVCLLTCLVSGLLAGCALLSAGQNPAEPVATFDLAAVVPPSAQGSANTGGGLQLIVQEPTALRSLAADRMLIKPSAETISFFPGAVWNDRLPRLLQARLVQTLQNSPAFDAVSDGRDRLTADLELATHLTAFHVLLAGRRRQSADGTPAPRRGRALLEMQLKLISVADGRVIEQRSFATSRAVARDSAEDAALALNDAFGGTLVKIATWLDDAALAHERRRTAAAIERPARAATLRRRLSSSRAGNALDTTADRGAELVLDARPQAAR